MDDGKVIWSFVDPNNPSHILFKKDYRYAEVEDLLEKPLGVYLQEDGQDLIEAMQGEPLFSLHDKREVDDFIIIAKTCARIAMAFRATFQIEYNLPSMAGVIRMEAEEILFSDERMSELNLLVMSATDMSILPLDQEKIEYVVRFCFDRAEPNLIRRLSRKVLETFLDEEEEGGDEA